MEVVCVEKPCVEYISACAWCEVFGDLVQVLEKEYEGTGQMAESSRIDNYPGFYGINGYELGEKIREHAQ